MKTVIELKSMKFHAFHGVSLQERKVGNDFTVDLEYAFDRIEIAVHSDDIGDTVSYADVYRTVSEEMSRPSNLLENLAGRISSALKLRFPQLSYIKIKVSKLHPPLGGEVHSASVTFEESWQS
ncbi:MAG: dihydroneopterin aldolase [Tannerella sp.]|jgi:dihydroneopterin aldolase|nr:dihydroneopterin aldolase [Tannerella sp.]